MFTRLKEKQTIAELAKEKLLYDFLDFGCSVGGSFKIAERLGGTHGLGIDIRPTKVAQACLRGINARVGDITQLDFPDKSVRFVVCSDVLEHLPDLQAVKKTIEQAVRVAQDFIYIKGPWFDSDEYLARLGLKLYWSDWRGHPCHLTIRQLGKILDSLGLESRWESLHKIIDSEDDAIHSLRSPVDQHQYIAGEHPEKPQVHFTQQVYRQFACTVLL